MASRPDIVHPAVRVVEGAERLWTEDPKQAADRAMLIVARLIGTGFLTGSVEGGTIAAAPVSRAAKKTGEPGGGQ